MVADSGESRDSRSARRLNEPRPVSVACEDGVPAAVSRVPVVSLREEWREWTIRHAERIHDLLEIRKGLEPFAAELAAERARESDLAAMEEAVEQMEPAVDHPDVAALVQADLAFHHALCAAAGNAALTEFADALGEQLLRERGTTWNLPGRPARSLVEHRAICDAVRASDPRRARTAALEHLESVEADLGASVLRPRDPTKKG